MASHDKKDPLTLNNAAPAAPKEAGKKDDEKIGYSAQQAAPAVNKEHIKRHNEAEERDKKLAAMLQANWGKRVAAEHSSLH